MDDDITDAVPIAEKYYRCGHIDGLGRRSIADPDRTVVDPEGLSALRQ